MVRTPHAAAAGYVFWPLLRPFHCFVPVRLSTVFKFLCARKTPLHPERYYPHARIRVFHHSGPEIPGSAREEKPRSFFLCLCNRNKKQEHSSNSSSRRDNGPLWALGSWTYTQ